MSTPEETPANPTPADHYERSYRHLAHAEVSSAASDRNELLLAAVAEAAQGLLLAFCMSQPQIDNPEQPEPPPAEPAPES